MLTAFADGAVFGERTGTNSPRVLALHGWRGDHTQMHKVADGFDAVTVDLPGFGASPEPTWVWGAADYASAVAPLLSDLEEPAVVVGYSFGGRVAVHLASSHPDKVGALVLTGVPLLRKYPSKKAPLSFRAMKLANRAGVVSNERMEAERRKRGSADYRASTGNMRDIFVRLVNESYEEQIHALQCPVELVWGENDTEAPLSIAKRVKEMLPNARLTVVPGGTHWLPTEDPEPVRAAVNRCLDEH